MCWTIKKCSFVQRLDERERDQVFGLACQPYIDLVLISNHCRSNIHFQGTGKASGSWNWLIEDLSFLRARDSAFFSFNPATAKCMTPVHVIIAESHISRIQSLCRRTHISAKLLQDQVHCELMSELDEPRSVATYGVLARSASVENGYDQQQALRWR